MHSGCAISGVVWLIAFTVQATRELLNKAQVRIFFFFSMYHCAHSSSQTSAPTVAVTYFILTLLIGIVIFAYPKARSTHHDAFERTHRFLGWTAVALVWVQVCIDVNLVEAFIVLIGFRLSCSQTTTDFLINLLETLCSILRLSGLLL